MAANIGRWHLMLDLVTRNIDAHFIIDAPPNSLATVTVGL